MKIKNTIIKNIISGRNLTVCGIVFIFSASFSSVHSEKTSLSIRGQVKNGTHGGIQIPDKITLQLVREFYEPIRVLDHPGAEFVFDKIPVPSVPLLITVEYKNAIYSKMIPPGQFTGNEFHKIIVYEPGALSGDIKLTSMVQLVKKKNEIHVTEIYSVNNVSSPKKNYSSGSFFISLPKNSRSYRLVVQHESAGLPVPVQMKNENGLYLIDHAFKPGISGLSIEYDIDGHSTAVTSAYLQDEKTGEPGTFAPFRIILWQPSDAVPKIGLNTTRINIPDLGEAIRVDYEKNLPISISMNDGGYVMDDPLEMWHNPVFPTPYHSVAGILIITIILFLIFYFLVRNVSPEKFLEKLNS